MSTKTLSRFWTFNAATRRQRFGVQARLRAQPVKPVGHYAETGGGEPHHGPANEDRKQRHPCAEKEDEQGSGGDVDANEKIDAPLKVPLVDLHEVQLRKRGGLRA